MKRVLIVMYWFFLKRKKYKFYKLAKNVKKHLETEKYKEKTREVSQWLKIVETELERDFKNWR